MYELPETEAIFWLAPEMYTGNLLRSYMSTLRFHMSWVTVRGDTSGKPTAGPSLVLIGRNGMKIAYGDDTFRATNASISVELSERDWYHVPATVKDILTRLRRTEYRGDPVTRVQFMSVLSDVETVLIRGTFHTDQVESVMMIASLYSGQYELFVERCECPPGYVGGSCERCAFGFARTVETTMTHERLGRCIQCDCNGHAGCDFSTGKCDECQHNTYGDQ